MLGFKIGDSTGGFRAYKSSALKQIDLKEIDSQGYCFQVDMVRRLLEKNLTVTEVPITFTERTIGSSKMSKNIVIEAFLRIGLWGVQRFLRIKDR
jgi:dolichol-phosphate mannosyltransferase